MVVISILLFIIAGVLVYLALKLKPIIDEITRLREVLEKIQKNPRGDAVDKMSVLEATKNYYRIMHTFVELMGIFAKQIAAEVSKIFAKK